jgi:hypothetical protein
MYICAPVPHYDKDLIDTDTSITDYLLLLCLL